MQATLAAAGLRAQLPARSVVARSSRVQRIAVSCAAAPQRQQVAAAVVPEPSAATALALSSLLMGAAPAWAEEAASEAADAAAAAASSGTVAPLGVTLAGWALVLSPVIFYAAFNVYRSQVDPKAKFGDAVFVFAALIILSNIVSITVFKTRLY